MKEEYRLKELEERYLDLLEKKEDGEDIGFDNETVLNEIIYLKKGAFFGERSAVHSFFNAVRLLIENETK